MAEQFFYIGRNDTRDEIQVTLKDSVGTAVNLTGGTVVFSMRKPGAPAAKVSAAATLVTPASGIVKYTWAAADTNEDGTYLAQWQFTDGAGNVRTFPNRKEDRLWVVVEADNS